MLLSNPIAVAAAQPLSATSRPQPPTNPLLVKVADIAPLSASSLPEQSEVVYVPPAPIIQSYNGSGDYYLDWIFAHESGGNPYAMNSIGACGLGQSLPCSKMLSVCGDLGNVSCQIDWFRNYCIAAYGSTYNAYLFWTAHQWY